MTSPPEASPPRAPRWAQKVALLFASTLIALLLAELVLRIAVPPQTTHAIWPPSVSHVSRPAAELYPDLSREARFTINSRGIRGPELGKDEDELRVLAIGGSTTECLYHDDPKAWTSRVAERLSEGRDKRVWVGAAARSGMNSGDHVLHAKHLLAELPRMDVVVLLLGVNDLNVALGSPETYLPTSPEMAPATQEKALRRAFFQLPGHLVDAWDYERSFVAKSRLYQLVKRVRRQRSGDLGSIYKLQDDAGETMAAWRRNRQQAGKILDALPDLAGGLATFRANLTSIAEIAKARGVPLVLMTQPTLWRADLGEAEQKLLWMGGVGDFQAAPGHDYYSAGALAEAMRRFNAVTLDVCREQGLPCLDLAREIPSDTTIFYDDCHFGLTGDERIAKAVAAHLATLPTFAER